jgi:hypothetical protein
MRDESVATAQTMDPLCAVASHVHFVGKKFSLQLSRLGFTKSIDLHKFHIDSFHTHIAFTLLFQKTDSLIYASADASFCNVW